MLAPWWCVNERTTNWFDFANAASNDQFVSLTKSALKKKIIKIIKTLLKNKPASSIASRLAVNCSKMRVLVNSIQILNILYQHTIIQLTKLDVTKIFKSEIFENSMELKLTLEIMNKKLTLEMQLARDPSNCIVIEYKLPWPAQGPNQS